MSAERSPNDRIEILFSREEAEELLRAAQIDWPHRLGLSPFQLMAYERSLDKLRTSLASPSSEPRSENRGKG